MSRDYKEREKGEAKNKSFNELDDTRKYTNIVIQLQKKNSFLEGELMKVQERSRLEKERTFKEIELVSQNYKKYADYYKRYLSEKNAFDRAQRDKVTLYLKI